MLFTFTFFYMVSFACGHHGALDTPTNLFLMKINSINTTPQASSWDTSVASLSFIFTTLKGNAYDKP